MKMWFKALGRVNVWTRGIKLNVLIIADVMQVVTIGLYRTLIKTKTSNNFKLIWSGELTCSPEKIFYTFSHKISLENKRMSL